MAKLNKAHTATARRIARRYGGFVNPMGSPDITTEGLTIEVETQATLQRGVRQLRAHPGPVYIAVTNLEALGEAMRLVQETHIGVMDPQGNIVREASEASTDGAGP